MADSKKQPRKLPIKFPEKNLAGIYANQMVVSHTREEFVMDFINLFPPEGVVNARLIVSPGHLKRMIRALQDNLNRYENHNSVVDAVLTNTPTFAKFERVRSDVAAAECR